MPPSCSQTNTASALADLLRDGEWSQIWEQLPSLPFSQTVEMLALLRVTGWQPEKDETKQRYRAALAASARFGEKVGARDGLLVIERTLPCALPVRCLRTAQNGRFVVGGTAGPGMVRVWEATTGEVVGESKVDDFYIAGLSVDQDGGMVAASGLFSPIEVLRLPDCSSVRTLTPPRQTFHQHVFCPDGRLLGAAFCGYNKDRPASLPGKSFNAHLHTLFSYCPSDWSSKEMQPSAHAGQVWPLIVSPDNSLVAAGLALGENTIVVRDTRSGMIIRTLNDHQDSIRKLCFSADGKYLASASYDGTAKVWETASWQVCASVTNLPRCHSKRLFPRPQFCAAFSGDGKLFAVAEFVKEDSVTVPSVAVYDVPSFRLRFRLNCCPKRPDYFQFTPSCKALVVGTIEGTRAFVQVWSLVNGRLLHAFPNAYVPEVSPNGKQLFISAFSHEPAVNVVEMAAVDFLLTPLCAITESLITEVRKLRARRSAYSLEHCLLELAAEVYPAIGRPRCAAET